MALTETELRRKHELSEREGKGHSGHMEYRALRESQAARCAKHLEIRDELLLMVILSIQPEWKMGTE